MTTFDKALLGLSCELELADGRRWRLPVHRWRQAADSTDEPLLACDGPTLDLGCGPGRLTAALSGRGVSALGVDSSPVAVTLTRERGGQALRRDLFDRLPGEGRWNFVVLADGNIGIGGDPVALLRRAYRLLAPGGSALVEVDRPGHGLHRAAARVRCTAWRHREIGPWFPWARVGAEAIGLLAREAGFVPGELTRRGTRWFARLERGA
ncbi:class I SAM-dependent methyltransferase [Pseudonocardiaceae bacterium YIM PH 21723]|nr:class I SAM-dependent methyltransferase [Pseudonocardiaceae bacterium YIM PH 21723]